MTRSSSIGVEPVYKGITFEFRLINLLMAGPSDLIRMQFLYSNPKCYIVFSI
jgi:hypothetical protein